MDLQNSIKIKSDEVSSNDGSTSAANTPSDETGGKKPPKPMLNLSTPSPTEGGFGFDDIRTPGASKMRKINKEIVSRDPMKEFFILVNLSSN
jgi:hypothetical protein